jgi:hypothetical protein
MPYERCVLKKSEENIAFCFSNRNVLFKEYSSSFTKDCILNYARVNQKPSSCFYREVLTKSADPTAISYCYKNSGGNISEEFCNSLLDPYKKYCLDRAGFKVCENCA